MTNSTQYGMIKKIEHFWKGLTKDRTQISALPPAQYGDRFYNFIEGNTMSAEELKRELARRKEQEVTQDLEATLKPARTSGIRDHQVPPMPDHLPPAPPVGPQSPEGRETVDLANNEARRTEAQGASENQVPDRTLRAAVVGQDKRDSLGHDHILPVVQETNENHENRPRTPATNKNLPAPRGPPPTPPKHTPNADHGYAKTNGINMDAPKMSRESLRNKSLPPLPRPEMEDSGVQMAT